MAFSVESGYKYVWQNGAFFEKTHRAEKFLEYAILWEQNFEIMKVLEKSTKEEIPLPVTGNCSKGDTELQIWY